jgi:hypothetical protein
MGKATNAAGVVDRTFTTSGTRNTWAALRLATP